MFLRGLYSTAIDIFFSAEKKKLMAKYTEGNEERQGIIPDSKLALLNGEAPIWVHAVSVGEVQAAVPFLRAARKDGWTGPLVLSTTTQTGKAMAGRLGAPCNFHIYYPWDKKPFVEKALDSLRPACFITAETELWPNMLFECQERNIPAFLINGRISDRTWERINRPLARGAAKAVFSLFREIFLRDEEDAMRLTVTGLERAKLHVMGDCKIDALLERKNTATQESWRRKLGPGGPIFIAGSTHTGEDEKVLAAFSLLRQKCPAARLIIVPRHPERAAAVAALVPEGFRSVLLSEYKEGWDVLTADRIGVLFDLYGASDCAFVGGSFADKGGQNILEPFSWGVPVQYGPHMEDFARASRAFIELGAATQVKDEKELAAVWAAIAEDKEGPARWQELSKKYFEKTAGAADKTWYKIKEYMTAMQKE